MLEQNFSFIVSSMRTKQAHAATGVMCEQLLGNTFCRQVAQQSHTAAGAICIQLLFAAGCVAATRCYRCSWASASWQHLRIIILPERYCVCVRARPWHEKRICMREHALLGKESSFSCQSGSGWRRNWLVCNSSSSCISTGSSRCPNVRGRAPAALKL